MLIGHARVVKWTLLFYWLNFQIILFAHLTNFMSGCWDSNPAFCIGFCAFQTPASVLWQKGGVVPQPPAPPLVLPPRQSSSISIFRNCQPKADCLFTAKQKYSANVTAYWTLRTPYRTRYGADRLGTPFQTSCVPIPENTNKGTMSSS